MSREWTKRELFYADNHLTKVNGKSLRDIQVVTWNFHTGNQEMIEIYNKDNFKPYEIYKDLIFLFSDELNDIAKNIDETYKVNVFFAAIESILEKDLRDMPITDTIRNIFDTKIYNLYDVSIEQFNIEVNDYIQSTINIDLTKCYDGYKGNFKDFDVNIPTLKNSILTVLDSENAVYLFNKIIKQYLPLEKEINSKANDEYCL